MDAIIDFINKNAILIVFGICCFSLGLIWFLKSVFKHPQPYLHD